MNNRIPPVSIQMPYNGNDITTWALPEGAISRFGRGRVMDMAFSPEKDRLIVGTRLGLWWYDLSTLTPIVLWETERGLVSAVAFSDCGTWVATANWDGGVKVYNVTIGVCETTIQREGSPERISQLVFSPDGQQLAASYQREPLIHLWNPQTGKEIAKFTSDSSRYPSGRFTIPVAFSPDGCLLAHANRDETHQTSDRISLWHVNTGECITHLRGHTSHVCALAFSPDGRHLASGDIKGTLREWDTTTGQQVRVSSEYAGKLMVIPKYTLSGRLRAAGVYKFTLAVWDVDSNKKLDTFEHRGTIKAIHFSNGTDLAVASSIDFKVWRLDTTFSVSSIVGHTRIPFSLKFSPDGQRLVSVGEGGITDWNIASKQPRHIRGAKANLCDALFTVDGNLHGLYKKENNVTVRNIETQHAIATINPPHEVVRGGYLTVRGGYFSVTGNLWACPMKDRNIYVWDATGKETVLTGHTDSIKCIAFAPNEKQVATVARDATARVWDVASGEEIVSLPLTPPLKSDSPLPIPSLDPGLYKGDAETVKAALKGEKLRYPNREIQTITFSPCGTLVAAGIEGGIRLWDSKTYETRLLILMPREFRQQFALAFSPCSRYLASGTWWWWPIKKVPIYVWDIATGKNIATFWGHPTDVQDLAFSPDGSLLASGSFDGTILLWDMKPYLHHETS
ncbi:WD40 repeat domain-containing protein [Candidatus Poribacteria bacterium]|nr:WD40 repeat domain-containing protein [Candidatus Poribacteria bacterium]